MKTSNNTHWIGNFITDIIHVIKVLMVWTRYMQLPLMAAFIAAGLAFCAISGIGPETLVVGAYDGETSQVIPLAVVALLFSFTLWDISRVIWHYGPDRYNLLNQLDAVRFTKPWQTRLFKFLLAAVYGSVPVLTLFASDHAASIRWYGWIGWVLAFFVIWIFSKKTVNWINGWILRRVDESAGPDSGWLLRKLRNVQAPGYRKGVGEIGIAHDHIRQVIMFIVCGFISFVVWNLPAESVCAVIYVLLLLIGLTWVCVALGFYFVRYHVPLFLVVGIWVIFGSFWFHPDYRYEVVKMKQHQKLPSAKEVLDSTANRKEGSRRIAVAAVGGGIHSGAWEVEVLTRLQELEGGASLPKRICALSGTSGGAYGALQYAHAMYHDSVMLNDLEKANLSDAQLAYLSKLRSVTQASSLGSVVRSLAYHDVTSYFLPLSWLGKDRGTAMEMQWAENSLMIPSVDPTKGFQQSPVRIGALELQIGRGEDLSQTTLGKWADEAKCGMMPAVLFTSGTEESGRPMIFGSSTVSDWNWNAKLKNPSSDDDCCKSHDYTVKAITGARLSASFPYVSPAARPDLGLDCLRRVNHQFDGGYYDNYGIVALNRWLQDALEEDGKDKDQPRKYHDNVVDQKPCFLIIQIRYKTTDSEKNANPGGFFYQVSAPLSGLYNSRVAGQKLRSDEEFNIFSKYWKEKGVTIDNAVFDFEEQEEGAPLSWHLTQNQKDDLTKQGIRIQSQYYFYKTARDYINEKYKNESKEDKAIEDKFNQEIKKIDQIYPMGSSAYKVVSFLHPEMK